MVDKAVEESYELTTGLLDDFDCEVLDAWWATDARYNNGQTALLFWKVATDDEDAPEDESSRWAAGADWESLDGGKTVEHPKGKTKFNVNSQVGNLISRAIELGAGPTLMERGPAQSAEIWVGLKFHMKREEFTFNIQGEERKGNRLLPTAFYGVGDGTPLTSAGSAESAAPAASALEGVDEGVVAALRKVKAETGSHSAFVDAAMELTEVTGNTSLVMALALPDGIYNEL